MIPKTTLVAARSRVVLRRVYFDSGFVPTAWTVDPSNDELLQVLYEDASTITFPT